MYHTAKGLENSYKRFSDLNTWTTTSYGYTRNFRGVNLILYRRNGYLAKHPHALQMQIDKGVKAEFLANIDDDKYLIYANMKPNSIFAENYKYARSADAKKMKYSIASDYIFITADDLHSALGSVFDKAYAKDLTGVISYDGREYS
jgi:hypothetical protein